MSKPIPVDYDPFEGDEPVAVDYNPFEDAEETLKSQPVAVDYDPFKTKEIEPEFGPLRESYKGIDNQIKTVLEEPKEEESEFMTIYRGNTPVQVKRNDYLNKVSEEGKNVEAFVRDVKKVTYSIPRGIIDLASSGPLFKNLTGLDMSKLEPQQREKVINTLTQEVMKTTTPLLSLVDWNDKSVVNSETGRIQPVETIAGMGLQLGAMVAGTKKVTTLLEEIPKVIKTTTPKVSNWMRKAVIKQDKGTKYIATALTKKEKFNKGVALLGGAEVVTHVMLDPEENVFNILEQSIDEDATGTAEVVRNISEFFSADADDTEAVKRLKLSIENLGFAAVFSAALNAPTIGRYLVGKDPSQMSKAEQEQALFKALEDEKQLLNIQDPSKLSLVKETAEGKAQVARQNNSFLFRMKQKYMRSRGYATPLMFHASNNSRYTQKQLVTEAQNVAERLDLALNNIADNKKLTAKVTTLLETDLTRVLKMPEEKQVSFFAKNRNIPEDVAAEILNFRRLQDNLSTRILNMKGFSDEAKTALTNNLGKYIRRTYRAYEDPNYKPTPKAIKNAEKYFVDEFQRLSFQEGKTLSNKDALTKAKAEIKKLLKADEEVVDYLAQVNRVANLKKKKNIDPAIRELLGEITNPSEKIVLSIAKLSRVSEMQQFYNVVDQLSKGKGGYVQGKEDISRGITVKINGTNSVLDGKYTTREMEKVILNKEETFKSLSEEGIFQDSWRMYVGAKGVSQSMKTVYSHTTQARNMLGAAQFMVANGRLGLAQSTPKSLAILEDRIFGARNYVGKKTKAYNLDNKALTDVYEEMLGLGVIGTSVNVNQFRDMISTGFRGSDSIYSELGVGQSKGIKTAKKIAKKPQELYSATDDFAKMSYYFQELDTLKKAFPDAGEELLKRRAASIVRNTMPNYDAIPKGIKQLRNLPLGNFISFPAEVMRTSFHVVRQASKEINSDSAVIKRRGQQRLLGFVTANVGYTQLAKSSYETYGMSDQEVEDRRVLKSGGFSSGHDLIYSMDEKGNYYTTNTEYLNSYYYLKEPVLAVLDRIETGELKGEELDRMLLAAMGDGIKALTDPFTDQSMIVAPFVNMAVASLSKSGEDLKGRELFPIKDSKFDNLQTIIVEGFKPLIPGSVISGLKLRDAINEKPNKYYGRFRDPEYAKLEQFGIKKDEYLEDDYLGTAVDDYKHQNNKNRQDGIHLETTSEERVADYFKVNAVEYQIQQDLYIKASAYDRLFGQPRALKLLQDKGLTRQKAKRLLEGTFTPISPVKNPTKYREDAIRLQSRERQVEMEEVINQSELEMIYARQEMELLSLVNVGDFKFKPEEEPYYDTGSSTPYGFILNRRTNKAIGGRVSTPVPNAPVEPDERINKLTGIPYNEEAGTAYMDEDDPMRLLSMAEGGRVTYSVGGEIVKMLLKKSAPAVKQADDSLEKTISKTKNIEQERLEKLTQENKDSQDTQRDNTVNTAIKAMEYLRELGSSGKVLDYGAGLGKNARAINADATFEPFPKEGFKPTYLKPSEIPENGFDSVISTNVINVLPKELRDEAVLTIGKTLKPKGKAIIQTWDVGANTQRLKSGKLKKAEEPNSSRDKDGGKFQKGFTREELRGYVDEVLGENFDVSITPSKNKIGKVSVLVVKKSEEATGYFKGGKVLKQLKRNCA